MFKSPQRKQPKTTQRKQRPLTKAKKVRPSVSSTTIKRHNTSKPKVDESTLSTEVKQFLQSKSKQPRGMYGLIDNNNIFNLGATINATVDTESWIYNLGSGTHPAAIWTTAPFSLPTSQLSPDGYHDPCLPTPPKPFTARMWGSGEIKWRNPVFIGANILQVAAVETNPQYKRGKNGDFIVSTYTNRWCDAENPSQIAAEETVNYIHRDPANILKPHTPDPSIKQPVHGVDFDFERPVLDLTEAVLFRYSAVTWNSHRIHYDRQYAQSEGYKDLLVHGPLQATLALDLLGAVSQAIAPDEPPLVQQVYHALNTFHRQEEKKQLQGHHHHSHSHGGKPCEHNHGGPTPEVDESQLTNLPVVPWHVRFQQLTHFGYELKQPLYVNTPVRVLAKVITDEFDVEDFETQQLLHQENKKNNLPAKEYAMSDLVRDKEAYVRVWIQHRDDPSLVYFNSTACFSRPNVIHYNQVPEKGLNMLLKDLQGITHH